MRCPDLVRCPEKNVHKHDIHVPALSELRDSVPRVGLNVDRHRPDSRFIRHTANSEGSNFTPPGKQRGYVYEQPAGTLYMDKQWCRKKIYYKGGL